MPSPLTRVAAFALVISVLSAGCSKDESAPVAHIDPLEIKSYVTTSITGEVVDEIGRPMQGVEVRAYGRTTFTDELGSFYFEEVEVPDERCVVACFETGFFPSVRTVKPNVNGVSYLQFVMMESASTHTIDAASGGTSVLDNGSSVTLQPNGLVLPSGETYSGQANLSIRYLDSSSPSFPNIVPGGDMLAQRTDQSTTILYSYGILRVLITTPDGENLQLASGKPSTLKVRIPDSQLSTAPATIPLWYFDDAKGFWIEEGSAVREGNSYIGTVAHFTDWNCDDPSEIATVIGRVVDCTGQPVITGQIYAGQSSSDLRNGTMIDNSTGSGNETEFRINVPARIPLFVAVPKPFTIISGEGGDLVMVPVPPLRPGQVYDVGTIQPHPCPTSISGTFVLNDNDAVESVSFKITDPGTSVLSTVPQRIFNPKSEFKLTGFPPSVSLSMEVKTTKGITVTIPVQTPEAGKNIDLGEIILNHNAMVTVSSVIACGNVPLTHTPVKFQWAGGSATVSTNNVGVVGVAVPAGATVTMSIDHEEGSLTKTFTVPPVEVHNLGVTDVCG